MRKINHISMELYETDLNLLNQFLALEFDVFGITENYLILYDFATDLKYVKYIQPDLLKYLLKYYFNSILIAQTSTNKIAGQICDQFNTAIFINKQTFLSSLGINEYNNIMNFYIKCLKTKFEINSRFYSPTWISFYNTVISFQKENLTTIFNYIKQSNIDLKISFFLYLSVLIFEKQDNFFYNNLKELYLESTIWQFESENSDLLYWEKDIILQFDYEITYQRIVDLFSEIESELITKIGKEEVALINQEINHSEVTFNKRKREYLEKMSYNSSNKYWNDAYTS